MIELKTEFLNYLNSHTSGIKAKSAQSVMELVAEGATVPFIARYRKEKTNNLDEVQIRQVITLHDKWDEIVKRKKFVLEEVEKQGNLTPELKKQIECSSDLAEIEELYRPFKRKKKSKAKIAKDAGISPFADWIWQVGHGDLKDSSTLEVKAKDYLNPSEGFATYEEVLRGAQHILVERLYSNADLRKKVRDDFFENGIVICKSGKKFKTKSKYEKYADFKESVKSLESKKASHRYLALRRGWQEDELTVAIEASNDELLKVFEVEACATTSQVADFLKASAKIALNIHMIPSVTNELHRKLKDQADQFAIQVFAENLRRVLMASPFGAKVVLGIDPGQRTGCKLALVDNNGQYISDTVIYLNSDESKAKAKKLFEEVFKQIKIEVVAVGNGTAGRETEVFARDTLKDLNIEVPVILVNESGASVYSASGIAREEFPNLDLTVRGAISIARRLQDPLAELVKVEPKSIGVGQYQHDVSQPDLKKSLYDVVESCVNSVGVNLNTASPSLLQYVSGIGPALAKNIVEYRQKVGLFKSRQDLLKVSSFSSKAFELAAGFMRIPNSREPLDQTGVHPERYRAVSDMAKELDLKISDLIGDNAKKLEALKEKYTQIIGEFTFNDIVSELKKPGLDPRDPYKVFKFREDIHEISDLKKELVCPGVVTNVTNFGAFVDIGVHQDGLVHLSQISHEFVDDPKNVLSPGDQVQVKVLDVDNEKKQISLTMLLTERPARERPANQNRSRAPKRASGETNRGGGRNQKNDAPRRDANSGDRRPQASAGASDGKPRRGPHKGKGPTGGDKRRGGPSKGGQNRGRDQNRRPRAAFNNPFAALANIKDEN